MRKTLVVVFAAAAAASGSNAWAAETYRLVHAIGNTEKIIAKGLGKAECAQRKREQIAVAEALGIHSERLGIGSITCLPESFFDD